MFRLHAGILYVACCMSCVPVACSILHVVCSCSSAACEWILAAGCCPRRLRGASARRDGAGGYRVRRCHAGGRHAQTQKAFSPLEHVQSGLLKLIKEKNVIAVFFQEIRLDNGKYCFGIQHVNEALEQGAVEKS